MSKRENFTEWLQQTALQLGARSAACLRMDNPLLRDSVAEHSHRVNCWMKSGMHGDMDYLQRMHADKSDPWTLFPFARSVIVVTFSNHWSDASIANPFPAPAQEAPVGFLSAYARGQDYHITGQTILSRLKTLLGDNILQAEGTVDTGAVYERLFAFIAGLGVMGGNNLLRDPVLGTRVFIACLFVDSELPEVILEPHMRFDCEDCRACSANCPTAAFKFKQPLDARRCISYLTIEKKGSLSRCEGEAIGHWIFGCDCCTGICPPTNETDLRIPVDLEWLLRSPASAVSRAIKGNACAYAGVTRLRRNAVVVLKNMNTPRANNLLEWVGKNTGSDLIRRQLESW